MHPTDFLINVTAHKDLHGVGGREAAKPEDDIVFVEHKAREVMFALTISEIRKHSWSDLEGVLTGTRAPTIMVQYTRITGYFARVNNFNKSKKAEVRDRQSGDYAVPEPA
ncbi:MAG: hypothetical protein ACYTFI_00870 [Planctomycetota bacterium]|jgi:hypothetical protein